jgi:hypothetical protein
MQMCEDDFLDFVKRDYLGKVCEKNIPVAPISCIDDNRLIKIKKIDI